MSTKSDRPRRRLSATEASRRFSRLLDEVERGRQFLVHRHGRDVCVISAPQPESRTAAECLGLLRSRPRVELDDRFGRDLNDVLAGEVLSEHPAWDS